jgi:hypothetical protein
MLDLDKLGGLLGFLASVAIFFITIARQKRFEMSDVGSFAAAFLSGSNIVPAVYLCWYLFDPDPDTVTTKLHGYEKYVSFAGLSFLFLSLVSFWALCRKAYKVEAPTEAPAAIAPSAPGETLS